MARLSAIKIPKTNGKMTAGYRISLPKVELEKNGFQEGDELDIKISKGTIRITKKE